jgi:hypothetical protein
MVAVGRGDQMKRTKLRAALHESREFRDAVDYLVAASSIAGHGTDRLVAILGATLLEDALEFAISRKMNPEVYSAHRSSIFDGESGCLNTFHSRILMGHALGVYGKKTFDALNDIKLIRNAFAHSPQPLHFEHNLLKEFKREIEGIELHEWEMTQTFAEFCTIKDMSDCQNFVRQVVSLATCIQLEVRVDGGQMYKRRALS